MKFRHHLPIVACILAVAAPAAEAQIYSWRDGNGALVLSDRRPDSVTKDVDRRPVSSSSIQPKREAVKSGPLAPAVPTAYRSLRPVETRFYNIYDKFIQRYAYAYGVNADLVRAVIQVESGFNPFARSPEGAVGLMQLMPDTAIEMGVKNRLDPEENIRGGVAYLRTLLNRYGDDVRLALAAYNAGPGAVDRHGTVPPYRETRQYVANVTQQSGDAARAPSVPPGRLVYKTVEMVDGRAVTRYSNTKPAKGPYEILAYR